MNFPIDLSGYKDIKLDLNKSSLSDEQLGQLNKNIQIIRDTIVFFTGVASAKGLGGHTGGAYDIVPEVVIINSLTKVESNKVYPVLFDEAGHRVAIQYVMAVINGYMNPEKLLHYREHGQGLYGHPERDEKNGIFFSSGRLGHMWSYVNGIAIANSDKKIVIFGSDGSQQEGDDSEASRFSVAKNLNINLIIDDNDVTIAGHPSQYLNGYNVQKTLAGHGLKTTVTKDAEDLKSLYGNICSALNENSTCAVINKRKMAVGIEGLEGTCKGHDVIPLDLAIKYLEQKNQKSAVEYLETLKTSKKSYTYKGSSDKYSKNRSEFGKIVCDIIKNDKNIKEKLLIVDSDLEGSCGLDHIRKSCPEIYVSGGIMERNNFSVAAGFGSVKGRQGIFATFSAFLEMLVSEITMARLNDANVLAHFSHAGVDDMADNTCHFGINNCFADNGLSENDNTMLYFPSDVHQLKAVMNKIFWMSGLRFLFSTRSGTPEILDEKGNLFYNKDYEFVPGKDEIIRHGKDIFIVTYGEMLYRCLDAVERLNESGLSVGLINKPTLNVVDEGMMELLTGAKSILFVESQNEKTGVGIRFGTWLLERGYKGKYFHMGTSKLGKGGLFEQIPYQGLDPESIMNEIRGMM